MAFYTLEDASGNLLNEDGTSLLVDEPVPQFVAESHSDYTAATINTAQTINLPPGTQEGDLLLLWISYGTTGTTITLGGTGWNEGHVFGGSDQWTGMWWKVAGASEPAPTMSSSDLKAMYTIAAYRGPVPGSIEVAPQFTDSPIGTTHAVQSMTVAQDAWIVSYVSADGTTGAVVPQFTAPTGFTKRVDWQNNASDFYLAALADSGSLAAGTYSSYAWTSTYADRAINVSSVAIRLSPAPQDFSGPAGLSGSGTLSGSSTVSASGSGALGGSGTLTGSGTASTTTSGTAAMSGAGALTLAGTPRPSGTAGLTGTGTLSLSGSVGANPTVTRRSVGTHRLRVWSTLATSVRLKVATDVAMTAGVTFTSPVTPASNVSTHDISPFTGGRFYYRAMLTVSGTEYEIAQVNHFDGPPAGAFSFCASSCCDAVDSAAMVDIAAWDDGLFIHPGDLYYNDAISNAIANFRAEFAAKFDATNHKSVISNMAFVGTPSDHDLMANNANGGSDPTAVANYNTVHREFFADSDQLVQPTTGVYRTFTRGPLARFIVTDGRTFATTPSATDDVNKHYLGTTQEQWVLDTIDAATEKWVIIVFDSPWIGAAIAGEDGWQGYTVARTRLANAIATRRAAGKNIVGLAGDQHALSADSGVNSPGGLPFFQCSPLNNTSSHKGGPYSSGTPYPTTTGTLVEQYARITVNANSIVYNGYSAGNSTPRVSLTVPAATVTLPPATETETAQPLGRRKRRTLPTAVETSTAVPLPRGAIIRPLPTAVDVSSARPLAAKHRRALPVAETAADAYTDAYVDSYAGGSDQAQTIVGTKRRALPVATEADSAVAPGRSVTATGSLSGSGTLSLSAAPAVSRTGVLSGSGALTLAGVPRGAGSLGLSGSGTLTGSGTSNQSGGGTLNLAGAGSLTSTSTAGAVGTLDLSGAGSLSQAAVSGFAGALTLAGAGSLSLVGVARPAGQLGLSGSGSLSLAGAARPAGALGLSGAGSLTATSTPSPTGTAGLSGSGSLGLSGVARPAGAVGFGGSGTLAASGTGTSGATAAMSGSGTLTTASSVTAVGTAGLSGSGALVASGGSSGVGSLTLSGSGTLGQTGTPAVSRTLGLSGSGTLTASTTPGAAGTAVLSGSGSLQLSSVPRPAGALNLAGSGTLSGALNATGAVVLSGSGTLSGGGQANVARILALLGTGLLTYVGKATPSGVVAMSGTGTLAGTGTAQSTGGLPLSGGGALSASTSVAFAPASGFLAGSGTLLISGVPAAAYTPPGDPHVTLVPSGFTCRLISPGFSVQLINERVRARIGVIK